MTTNPSKRLHPQAYEALAEALTTFQWYKPAFAQMLAALFASDTAVLAGIDLTAGTKRAVSREVVGRLQRDERRYQGLTLGVLMSLADYDPSFRHLARLDDGAEKAQAAQDALTEVRRVVGQHKSQVETQRHEGQPTQRLRLRQPRHGHALRTLRLSRSSSTD